MAEIRTSRSRRAIAMVAVSLAAGIGVAQPADARDPSQDGVERDAARDDVPRGGVEVMQLSCEADGRDAPAIGCRWSVVEGAAAYRLIRADLSAGTSRTTVARIDDPTTTWFVDTPVRRGVRYGYVVQAFDAAGMLVAVSRLDAAGVAVPPTIQQLRLECSATSSTTVRCEMPTPVRAARTLTVWRSVDGAARDVVATFNTPFPASYGDVVPDGTSKVVYAVIATDGGGEIVARSRAELVTMPPQVDVTPQRDVVIDAEPAPTRRYGDDDVARPTSRIDAATEHTIRRGQRPEVVDR